MIDILKVLIKKGGIRMKKPFLLNYQSETENLNEHQKDIDFKNNVRSIYKDNLEKESFEKTILIFARIDDPEIDYLGPYFIKNNINYIRIDAEYFLQDFFVDIDIANGNTSFFLYYKDEKIDLKNVDAIWTRHFKPNAYRSIFCER